MKGINNKKSYLNRVVYSKRVYSGVEASKVITNSLKDFGTPIPLIPLTPIMLYLTCS